MTFNDVTVDFSGVAGSKLMGNAKLRFDAVDGGRIDCVHGKSSRAQVLDPTIAASTVRVFGDGDLRGGIGTSRQDEQNA
jgi:hypothetical protein